MVENETDSGSHGLTSQWQSRKKIITKSGESYSLSHNANPSMANCPTLCALFAIADKRACEKSSKYSPVLETVMVGQSHFTFRIRSA